MNDDWTPVAAITDGGGKLIEIAHAEGKVRIAVKAPVKGIVLTAIVLDGEARDAFVHAFAVAESQAEAFEAAIG